MTDIILPTQSLLQLLLNFFATIFLLHPATSRRDVLLAVMERCRGGAARLKGYLPPETVVAHKMESLDANATDDVGVITLPDGAGHIAIAIFVGKSEQLLAEREPTIAHLARAIYDYFLFQPLYTAAPTR